MSIFDAIKNSVLEGFDTSLTVTDILLGLSVSLLAGLFILLIYKSIQTKTGFNRGFGLTLLMITSVSALIVLTITSNLALSLGMVGALSIVRFRTAIKDPSDTAFMFWAVAAGITAGAGFYFVTLIGCLFIGVICVVSVKVLEKTANTYLLVIRAESDQVVRRAEAILANSSMRFKLTAMTDTQQYTEAIFEVALQERKRGAISEMRNIPGVRTISLVDCRKS